ncbi:metallophosphoesterase [Methanocella arvoryzae]|uniref:Predicted metallophosphoesterase n=1 Tax=Methanocella arvoryzae (strain DSM 22066 / NBRC 105507 / MRE50) TaxID=351160 RepID=Q0W2D9_METAR|nr:metallophosphoesterase [Methanocella arvoryzae]CAJ37454.1 predicted metallophosphoesterase [Methanocella arvoryzae MRE50]
MRLLAVTDFHNTFDRLPDILERAGKVDGTLMAGDFTQFGPTEQAKALLEKLPRPVLAVPGNCDQKDIIDLLREEDANLHENKIRLGNVTFIGIGGSNPTPFNTPIEFSEEHIKAELERLLHGVTGPVVLLSHAPPKGHVDEIPGGIHVGSTSVAELAPKFTAIVCGHIHESRGISHLGKTVIVNPGPASIGNAAILEIDDSGHAKADLI